MTVGLIKWFDKIKGFGVIGTPDKGDFFLHENSLNADYKLLKIGTPVYFNEKTERNKNTAKNCQLIRELNDLHLIIDFLEKKDTVPIEITVKGISKWGNPYKKNEIENFSIVKISLWKIKNSTTVENLNKFLKNYYEEKLDSHHFVSYCKLIDKIYDTKFKKNALNEEIPPNSADSLFVHFGSNIKDRNLFEIWQSKKFRFIGKTQHSDYEIPQKVLQKFKKNFDLKDLERIVNYDYGKDYVYDIIDQALKRYEESKWNTKGLLKLINQLKENHTQYLTEKLLKRLERKTKNNIKSKVETIGKINSEMSFKSYYQLNNIIPFELKEPSKIKLKELINNLIIENTESNFKVELWLKGFNIRVPDNEIKSKFNQDITAINQRITILINVSKELRDKLIAEYFISERPKKGFELIELLLKRLDDLNYKFSLKETLFDTGFWEDKKSKDVLDSVKIIVNSIATPEENYTLFFLGLTNKFPAEQIKNKVLNLNQDELESIIKHSECTEQFLFDLIEVLLKKENILEWIDWLYSITQDYLSPTNFNRFDNLCFSEFNEFDYYKLWEKGKGKITPQKAITGLLDEYPNSYKVIPKWKINNIVNDEVLLNVLLTNLDFIKTIKDRKTFYTAYYHIRTILHYQLMDSKDIKGIKIEIIPLLLWFFNDENSFNFELLKRKFIYFNPQDQVKVIKKIFHQINNHNIQLTIEELNEIMRIDLDLYKTNQNFNPEIILDISTDIVIKSILNYKKKGKFLIEGELLKIVLHNLYGNNKRKFELGNYFETCKGRMTAEFDWIRNGEISKIPFGNNQFYYCIKFDYDSTLVEKIKTIPGRKYNSDGKHWGIPSRYTDEVLKFAQENRFYLDFEGSNYSNNVHLARFKREDVPKGITFCDGRISNTKHKTYKKTFWWCVNQPCFQNCETTHSVDEWENYTFLDFLLILGFNLDETKNNPKDLVLKGEYYKFISLLNRFNRLLEKIYCTECDEILYPTQTSHFAAHTVVRFCCENKQCSQHKNVIYLNNCLNGKCNSIIDSRVSKKCTNGLYICETCGSCCSHSFFKRRKENLEIADNFNNEQKRWIYNDTKRKYDNKLGHLERADYFCHKDGKKMKETETDIFECSCGNKYDTKSYKIKRLHRHLTPQDVNDNDILNELRF